MKNTLLFLCLLTANNWLLAQDYLEGKLTDDKGNTTNIYYDRTQLLVSSKVHQTLYKVLDESKHNLYTIFITHDQDKASVSISVSISGSDTKGKSISYDKQRCGLIFNEVSNIDTMFPAATAYLYLFSFTDTMRDYPVLHKIKTSDQKEIELDPLTRLRVRKHNDLVRKFAPVTIPNLVAITEKKKTDAPIAKTEDISKENSLVYSMLNDTFNNQLFALRDSLYGNNARYIDVITKMKADIESDLAAYMKNARIYSDEERYGGQERDGQADGKGVLVAGGNIYDGTFAKGTFISGASVLKTKTSVYYGESYKDTMNGKGWLKFNNGSFLLGEFKNGKLYSGISLSKDNSEVFFGNFKNNQRNGYGELRNSRGDSFYGEFLNGRLIKGYSKEVDQFGYSTYSRIQNGTKATVAAQLAEVFFDKIHMIKEKAEIQP